MKIIELYLEKYSRMRLNHIETFVYRPIAKTQVILGTNGSGKSSLLHEMSPLPANHKNYAAGGKKIIKISHKSSLYELSSTFEGGQSHSFIKDGRELNDGSGTYSVQLDLVQKHFGITPKIHELALGVRKFHAMSVGERREWFTMLSDANYDYAISVYNKLKEQIRDISGAIKIAKKKLSLETNKIYSDKELEQLEEKCSKLYSLVTTLQETRMPETLSLDSLESQRQDMLSHIEDESKRLSNLIKTVSPYSNNLNEIEDRISALTDQKKSYKLLSDQFFKDHEKLSEKFELAKKIKQQSIEEIRQKIKTLDQKIEEIRKSYKLQLPEVTDPYQCQAQIETVFHWLENILIVLSEHKHKNYTPELKETTLLSLGVLQSNIDNYQVRIERLSGIISHLESLKSQDKVECPNCKHQWILGFDQSLYDDSKKSIQTLIEQKKLDESKITELKQSLSEITEYLQAFDRFTHIVKSSEMLEHFWNYVLKEDVIRKDPSNLPFLLDQYRFDLEHQNEVNSLILQIKNQNALVKEALANDSLDYDYIAKTKLELEEKIANLQDLDRDNSKELKFLQSLHSDIIEMRSAAEYLDKLLSEYEEHGNTMQEMHRRRVFNEMLRTVHSTLSKYESQLHEAKNHQSVIKNIESQITQLENEERCLKAAAKSLSPTEGLIAEGLFGFMRLFIQQMNNFIKRIWTYPLVVQPCELGNDGALDLDYKFPVVVDTADNVRKDVSEGSSAMHEVIDLAFKITAMKALHLDDYPLFLDEFGSTMDPTHKAATIQLINSIMEQDHFSQLFMISHDTVQYGALSNTEVCVLSTENMLLPKDAVYNQHVVING